MKKIWIAASLLGTAAAAQAQSSVTLFGLMDVGYTRDGGSIASARGLSTSGTANSRLGFRGSEDLGGGYKAEFWLETGFNVDSGAANQNTTTNNFTPPSAATGVGALQFGRRSTVGLVTPYGELRMGRDIVPTFYTDFLSPFGVNSVSSDVSEQANLVGLTQQRTSNGFHYFTPNKFGGFTAHLHYALGEQPSNVTPTASKKDGNYAGARVSYKGGPVEAHIAYGQLKLARAGTGLRNDRSEANVSGAYDFGVARLSAEYSLQKIKNTVGGGFAGAGGASAGNDTEGKTYSVGLSVPVGAGKINASYSRIRVENGHGLGTEPQAAKVSLGYIYNLSKRTALYTSVAHLKNSDGTATGATLTAAAVRVAGITGAIAGPNTSSTAYEAGIRHSF